MAKKIFKGIFGGGKKKAAAATPEASGPRITALTPDEVDRATGKRRVMRGPFSGLGGTILSDKLGG